MTLGRIAFVGNCQMEALHRLYQRLLPRDLTDLSIYVAAYNDATAEQLRAVAEADRVVWQMTDFDQAVSDLEIRGKRYDVPLIIAPFMWPYAGQAHPRSAPSPWLPPGPYSGDGGDSFLNAEIGKGTPVEDAVRRYIDTDVARVTNVHRRFEIVMGGQRRRDRACGYDIAGMIEHLLPRVKLFTSRGHYEPPLLRYVAETLFAQMGASGATMTALRAVDASGLFPEGEVPVHPSIATALGLKYLEGDPRFEFFMAGGYTFAESCERYMRFDWSEDLLEAVHWTNSREFDKAIPALERARITVPRSRRAAEMLLALTAWRERRDAAVAVRRQRAAARPIARAAHDRPPLTTAFVDGTHRIVRPDGQTIPITQLGEPVTEFLPGWRPGLVWHLGESMLLLTLVHENGETAAWYLDRDGALVTNTAARLPPEIQPALADTAMESLTWFWDRFIAGTDRNGDGHDTPDPLALPIQALAAADIPGLLTAHGRDADPIVLEGIEPWDRDDLAARGLDEQILRSILDRGDRRRSFEWQVSALRDGVLRLPHPMTGDQAECRGALYLGLSSTAYVFGGVDGTAPFLAVTAGHEARLLALYFPALDLTVFPDAGAAGMVSPPGAPLESVLLAHCAEHPDLLAHFFRAGPKRVAPVVCNGYFKHHLWNELSGLSALVDSLPLPALTWIPILGQPRTELYGTIEALFPELAHLADRRVESFARLVQLAYATGALLLRPCLEYIPASVRHRIAANSQEPPETDGRPVVLLGLRVENRTAADQIRYHIDLIQFLRNKLGPLTVVFDGHNAHPAGGLFLSAGEDRAVSPPVLVELGIYRFCAEHFAGDDGIDIRSAIGQPLTASIAWARKARFFVAPWGSGLVKYRWAANAPGFIVSNTRILADQTAVRAFASGDLMEAPSLAIHAPPECVADAPDAPVLAPTTNPASINFHVRTEPFLQALDRFIEDLSSIAS